FASVLCSFAHGRFDLAFILHDHNAHCRSFAWRLDDDRQRKRRTLFDTNHFPERSRHAVFTKFFLCANLVESGLTSLYAFTGISNAPALQNSLQLTIFAESSVNGDEGKIYVFRKREVFVTNIDIDDFCT